MASDVDDKTQSIKTIDGLAKNPFVISTIVASLYAIFVALSLGQTNLPFSYLPDSIWYLKLPFAFLASWVLAFVGITVFNLFDDGERHDLAIVCGGGALGGFALKFAVLLIEATSRPAIPLDHAMCALLGAMCAGFTIFTISDTERRQKTRLFFLSVAAGLAFPSIVLSTMKFETEAVVSAEKKVEKASELKEGRGSASEVDREKQIDALSGEVASEANEITNATNLPLEERKRQLEKLEPLAQSAFESNSSAVKAITEGKRKLDGQIAAQVEPVKDLPPAAVDPNSGTRRLPNVQQEGVEREQINASNPQ